MISMGQWLRYAPKIAARADDGNLDRHPSFDWQSSRFSLWTPPYPVFPPEFTSSDRAGAQSPPPCQVLNRMPPGANRKRLPNLPPLPKEWAMSRKAVKDRRRTEWQFVSCLNIRFGRQ